VTPSSQNKVLKTEKKGARLKNGTELNARGKLRGEDALLSARGRRELSCPLWKGGPEEGVSRSEKKKKACLSQRGGRRVPPPVGKCDGIGGGDRMGRLWKKEEKGGNALAQGKTKKQNKRPKKRWQKK